MISMTLFMCYSNNAGETHDTSRLGYSYWSSILSCTKKNPFRLGYMAFDVLENLC